MSRTTSHKSDDELQTKYLSTQLPKWKRLRDAVINFNGYLDPFISQKCILVLNNFHKADIYYSEYPIVLREPILGVHFYQFAELDNENPLDLAGMLEANDTIWINHRWMLKLFTRANSSQDFCSTSTINGEKFSLQYSHLEWSVICEQFYLNTQKLSVKNVNCLAEIELLPGPLTSFQDAQVPRTILHKNIPDYSKQYFLPSEIPHVTYHSSRGNSR